jgi:hypothetical protein
MFFFAPLGSRTRQRGGGGGAITLAQAAELISSTCGQEVSVIADGAYADASYTTRTGIVATFAAADGFSISANNAVAKMIFTGMTDVITFGIGGDMAALELLRFDQPISIAYGGTFAVALGAGVAPVITVAFAAVGTGSMLTLAFGDAPTLTAPLTIGSIASGCTITLSLGLDVEATDALLANLLAACIAGSATSGIITLTGNSAPTKMEDSVVVIIDDPGGEMEDGYYALIFAGGGGTGAAANGTVTGGALEHVEFSEGGKDYTSPPTVALDYTGPDDGRITSVAVIDAGSGMDVGVYDLIFSGDGSGGAGTATVAEGAVTELAIGSGGAGYTVPPTVTLGYGVGNIARVIIHDPGSEMEDGVYDLIFTGDGSDAAGTATVADGEVVSVTLDDGGTGYSAASVALDYSGAGTPPVLSAALPVLPEFAARLLVRPTLSAILFARKNADVRALEEMGITVVTD